MQERQAGLHPACGNLGLHPGDNAVTRREERCATRHLQTAEGGSLPTVSLLLPRGTGAPLPRAGGRCKYSPNSTRPLEEEGGPGLAVALVAGSLPQTLAVVLSLSHTHPHLPAFWKHPLFFCFRLPGLARQERVSLRQEALPLSRQ